VAQDARERYEDFVRQSRRAGIEAEWAPKTSKQMSDDHDGLWRTITDARPLLGSDF
jgi:hypothetical protein